MIMLSLIHIFYYLMYYMKTNETMLSSTETEGMASRLTYLVENVLNNKAVLMTILIFACLLYTSVIGPHTLFGNYPPKIAEPEIKPVTETGEIVLNRVVIPEYVIVHDGVPTDLSLIHISILLFCGKIILTETDSCCVKIQTENLTVARKYFTLLKMCIRDRFCRRRSDTDGSECGGSGSKCSGG